MKRPLLILFLHLIFVTTLFAQTSFKSGTWTDNTVWNGGSAPGTGWVTINIASGHTVTKATGHQVNGTLNVNGNLTLSGNVTMTSGSTINVYGNLTITGNLALTSNIKVFPGGTVTVDGSVSIVNSDYLTIGTSAAGPPYANFIVKTNITSTSSGDVLIERNGRLALFGNYTGGTGGGTLITIKDGGQAYIHGITTFTGTGDHLKNDNDGNPYYGVYSPNQPVYTQPGQGSSSNGAAGPTNSVQGASSIPSEFLTWLQGVPGSPLPIKLLYFKVSAVNETGIALEWATSMEKDFSHFEVQRASSDLNFSVIGIVEGRGSLQAKTVYSLLDNSPVSGKNYYRLKAVDVDGSSEYFTVIVAEWSGSLGLSLYPNPAVNKSFSINIGDEFDQPVNLVVYEARGIAIYSASLDVKTKVVELPSDTAPGVYLVRIGSPAKNKVVRLVVE